MLPKAPKNPETINNARIQELYDEIQKLMVHQKLLPFPL